MLLYEVLQQGMSFQLTCTCNLNENYVVSTGCYILTSLPQDQAAKTKMLSVVRIQQKDYAQLLGTLGKYLLFTNNLTSTNMHTAQQKKGH